jgi:hypothetical protein
MPETSTVLVVRLQAWFRAMVDSETLEPFAVEKADQIALNPIGALRSRVLLGRGPIEHQLSPQVSLWFDHGEEPYPVLQCPSVGPKGAGLRMSTAPVWISAKEQEAISLLEVSAVQPVDSALPDAYSLEVRDGPDVEGGRELRPASAFVQGILAEASRCLDQAVGLYALYQYPIVWEPITSCPLVGFADLEGSTLRNMTQVRADNFVPFRLRAGTKIQDGHLVDGVLASLPLLAEGDLHIPFVLLQRALWQKNVQVRFLENFLVIEHLMGQFAKEDADRNAREEFFATVDRMVQGECPQHLDRLRSLKGVFIQAPLRKRLEEYFKHLGIDPDDDLIPRMLKLRNDLAHGGKISANLLLGVELETRRAARRIMEKELALRGVSMVDS